MTIELMSGLGKGFKGGRLNLGEMVEVSLQYVALQDKTRELPFAQNFDQASVFKLFHVMGERGRTDRLALAQIRALHGTAFTDSLQNVVTTRIGQSPRN